MPALLSSLHNIPTSHCVTILVDVNQQANCDNVKGLVLTATITRGDQVISTREADFADNIFVFDSIFGDGYTCSVTVEDESGVMESMQIMCGKLRNLTTSLSFILYKSQLELHSHCIPSPIPRS